MKKLLGFLLVLAPMLSFAADWNYRYGIGNPSGEWKFSGTGVPFGVIASQQSNSVYWVGSPSGGGVPVIEQVFLTCDLAAGTLKYYVADGVTTLAAGAIAGTNVLSLTSTSGIVANALHLLRNKATDSYQMLYNSNSVATTFVSYNTITNAATAGDELYHLVEVQSYTPLAMLSVTNQVLAPFSETIPFSINKTFIPFYGRRGWPSALVLTYSNAASMRVMGEYYVQPRR